MSDIIQINASKARDEFFRILEEVYLENKTFLIKKAGIPVAKINSFGEILKDKEAEKTKDYLPVLISRPHFDKWQRDILPRYKKIKAKELISLIRNDRDRE